MSAADLIAPITGTGDPVRLPAESWMQGRTLYGGASALIAYTAAIRAYPHLPPLRSAQIAFVAPVGAMLTPRVTTVREGRNVVQLRSELLVEGRIAFTAFFLFAAGREVNAAYRAPDIADWPGAPEDNPPTAARRMPDFIRHNYEMRRAETGDRSGAPVMRRWVRMKDEPGLDPLSLLVLMGDTLPPGAIRAMERPGPLSSINWTFNVIDPEAPTRDRWFLAENASEYADAGYSSERLRLWNTDGRPLLSGQQLVAIFG